MDSIIKLDIVDEKSVKSFKVIWKSCIVHNFYKEYGGEDSNIYEEFDYFKENFEVNFL